MEQTIRNLADGRNEAAHDAGHDSPASRDSAGAGSGSTAPVSTDAAPAVRLCQWCKDFRIQGMTDRRGILSITFRGGQTVGEDRLPVRGWGALWAHGDKSEWLMVQDGICEGCAEALKDGRVISEGSTTL